MLGVLAIGMYRYATNTMPEYTAPASWAPQATEALGILLILRAFASGSVALTGTEAVSNGVPAFKKPETRNAQTVITIMGASFATHLHGPLLPRRPAGRAARPDRAGNGHEPDHAHIRGRRNSVPLPGADRDCGPSRARGKHFVRRLPAPSSILAKDGFLPRTFQFRGERLAFNSGIVVLAIVSAS